MKILTDSNVLLDVLQRREPHFTSSAKVIGLGMEGAFRLYAAAHSLTTIHYLSTRLSGKTVASTAIRWVLDHFTIAEGNVQVFERAYALNFADFEDAVVAAMAEANGCDFIVTRDVRDFATSPVPAVTPSDFLIRP